MSKRTEINTGWKIGYTAYVGNDMRPPRDAMKVCTLDAEVPGDVHLDLMRDGVLPDLYKGMNLDHALWMEEKDWWYRCEFNTPTDIEGKQALLVFHGLDTFASIWVNQQPVGESANMFIRHEYDVTQYLSSDGPNELVVRLAAPAFAIPVDLDHCPMGYTPQRVFCRKAQMSFGWDIAPRLLTAGIWRPVELVLVDAARLTGLRAITKESRTDSVRVEIEAEVTWHGEGGGEATVNGQIHDTPWKVTAEMTPGQNTVSAEVELKEPPLWWPIGYGLPSLVKNEAVLEVDGRQVDTRSCVTGLRTIELIRKPQSSGAESFMFRCNDKDVLVTGFNWTPLDAIFARTKPEHITATLERLATMGCNMLRVWGGAVYEQPHFYEECSRLGIMVWQDFMMACSWYPQTDAFAAELAVEAEQVVRDLRGFPCIALWNGDNEVDACYRSKYGENRLTYETIAKVCERLDPQTQYIPSSPWVPSGKDTNWLNQEEGCSHRYNHGRDYKAPEMWDIHPRFMAEFGIVALPSLELIREYFPEGTEWPLTGPMWRYHGADTTRTGKFRGPEGLLSALKACGKPEPTTIEEAVPATQELQAEAVCSWVERYCEDPEFGGFLIWNTADCWPQQSDSMLDYKGNAKPVFERLGPLFERVRRERG